jgi:hypothetical protein
MENTRQKQVYDIFFKTRSRRFGWMVLGAFLLEHIGDKIINAFWVKKNQGVCHLLNKVIWRNSFIRNFSETLKPDYLENKDQNKQSDNLLIKFYILIL